MKSKTQVILLLILFCPFYLFGQVDFIASENQQDSLLKSAMLLAAGDSLGIESGDVPNVFTPNGDEINDFFVVDTPDGKVYDFRIFTRTGTQVYSSTSPRVFWDGRNSGGNELPEGIYYYVIKLSETSAPNGLSGFVYIYR